MSERISFAFTISCLITFIILKFIGFDFFEPDRNYKNSCNISIDNKMKTITYFIPVDIIEAYNRDPLSVESSFSITPEFRKMLHDWNIVTLKSGQKHILPNKNSYTFWSY